MLRYKILNLSINNHIEIQLLIIFKHDIEELFHNKPNYTSVYTALYMMIYNKQELIIGINFIEIIVLYRFYGSTRTYRITRYINYIIIFIKGFECFDNNC